VLDKTLDEILLILVDDEGLDDDVEVN